MTHYAADTHTVPVSYVLGYAFDPTRQLVLLIKKNRPDWMCGKLNAVGGKIESGETAIRAMIREFKEEAAIDTTESNWKLFRTFAFISSDKNDSFTIDKFVTVLTVDQCRQLDSPTDELVSWYYIDHVFERRDIYRFAKSVVEDTVAALKHSTGEIIKVQNTVLNY
jgi:8-oxo-dGTP pyrophosphatase MutT (NUDIX family)